VGGKTAVNHPKGKNLIGAFYQPRAVFIDPEVLRTLDLRELRAGLAEVVKYGVIWDEKFFSFLEEHSGGKTLFEPGPELEHAIERSCGIKAEVVGADETERGLRSILNFGHTFGHAIEALSGYGTYKHGEAVAMGMVMAARYSAGLGLCRAGDEARVRELVSALGLPTTPPGHGSEEFIASMRLDKKVSGGRIRLVLIDGRIGRVATTDAREEDLEDFFAAPGS
jgi:3-dehydroquinate synthase